jgi:hypothetical protein
VQVVADGGDPAGVEFDEAHALVSIEAGNYILQPSTTAGT